MKKNYLLTMLLVVSLALFNSQEFSAQFTLAADNASDAAYGGGFGDGINGGDGFSAWSINYGANTGTFAGNPSNNGMGTTGIGTNAWGFYATGTEYVNALRTMTSGMEFGDELTFYWTLNWDANGGNKGFDLKNGGTTVFNINNSGTSAITSTNGAVFADYGTDPMLVTLTRTSSSEYSFTMTKRGGADTDYSTTITSGVSIDGINIYSGNQNDGDGNRNIYFNEFSVQNDGVFNIASGTETYSKNLTGTGNLSKSGAGTLILSGTNTYSGTTIVSAGVLQLNSSLASSDVTVNSGATLQISSDATISSLTVNDGGMVTVDTGVTLTISNDLTLSSGSSMVVEGSLSLTGNATFNRNLANGAPQWYLMSSPVTGETYDDAWVTDNSIPSGTTFGTNRGVSWYDNATNTMPHVAGSAGHWRYMQGGGSGSFSASTGYGIIRSGSGDISFIGTDIYTTSQTFPLTLGVNNYNLVGNPFTASLNLGDFFADNGGGVITGAQTWFWNGASYDVRTSGAHAAFEIAPGQGFFVEAAAATNLTFDIADVSHTAATFQKSNPRPEVTLTLKDGLNTRNAYVYYIDGTTTDYDLGYDGNLFGGVNHTLAIYSHLVNNDQGEKFQLQSLPNSDLESIVIPVGVIANAGEITFSANALNLPTGIKVFLEDRNTNTFTRLDEANTEYKVTLTENANGIGRFYLHTAQSALNINSSLSLENISIYKANTSTLRVVGLQQGNANVKLFNILGKQMLNTSFQSNGVKDISLPTLAKGIYIVQLTTDAGKLNKKIVLE